MRQNARKPRPKRRNRKSENGIRVCRKNQSRLKTTKITVHKRHVLGNTGQGLETKTIGVLTARKAKICKFT